MVLHGQHPYEKHEEEEKEEVVVVVQWRRRRGGKGGGGKHFCPRGRCLIGPKSRKVENWFPGGGQFLFSKSFVLLLTMAKKVLGQEHIFTPLTLRVTGLGKDLSFPGHFCPTPFLNGKKKKIPSQIFTAKNALGPGQTPTAEIFGTYF